MFHFQGQHSTAKMLTKTVAHFLRNMKAFPLTAFLYVTVSPSSGEKMSNLFLKYQTQIKVTMPSQGIKFKYQLGTILSWNNIFQK